VEDATDLESLLVAGHAAGGGEGRGAGSALAGLRVVGRLLAGFLIGTATAVSAIGGTMALGHSAWTRSVDTVFVTPDVPVAAHPDVAQPGAAQLEAAPGEVVPSEAAPSHEPDPSTTDEGHAQPAPAGPVEHLNDGLSDDPGQPVQPAAPQDPHSNG
jgi:hypothetical protein